MKTKKFLVIEQNIDKVSLSIIKAQDIDEAIEMVEDRYSQNLVCVLGEKEVNKLREFIAKKF